MIGWEVKLGLQLGAVVANRMHFDLREFMRSSFDTQQSQIVVFIIILFSPLSRGSKGEVSISRVGFTHINSELLGLFDSSS
jgi:phenylalanine-4-hydroxylase